MASPNEVALLREEIQRLQLKLENNEAHNNLFLVFMGFQMIILFAVVLAVFPDITSLWRQYEYLVNPMLPPHSEPEKRLARWHDIFNIVILPIIVVLDIYFVLGGDMAEYSNRRFWRFYWFTNAYILVDLIWVAAFPKCVKSVTTIIVHHVVTIAYMGIPAYNASVRWGMAVALTVELNTWFMIMRRMPIAREGIICQLVKWPFYITWYVIRCGLYPYMIYEAYGLWTQHVATLKANKDPTHVRASYLLTYMAVPLIFQTMLSGLNVWWTYNLIRNSMKGKKPDKGL